MDLHGEGADVARFTAYLAGLASVLGHVDRVAPLRDYCTGLLLPAERKSVEPMAALTAPARTSAQHQCLLHFVGQANWSDEKVLAKVREQVLPAIETHGPITAWILDDTGFPKKGKHSVGVARQYCGQLGKQDNCQVAVSLSVANAHASLPVAYRMYLPKSWADDPERRAKAGVPDDVGFKTKPEIALDLIKWACATGLAPGVVLIDGGYGVDTDLRSGVSALGLLYAVGIGPGTTVWAGDMAPLPPKPYSGRGRRPVRPVRDQEHQPVSVAALALSLPETSWQTITWREGTNTALTSRFARVRVRAAHDVNLMVEQIQEEWLVIERPEDETEPTKYWLSTLNEAVTFEALVGTIKLRWRIERDYLELKQEIGLGDYEGRGWRGFHHHATLCIAAYGFLVLERAAFPPSGSRSKLFRAQSPVPRHYRPRGSASPP
jgi:SRSO17 transposase